MTLRLPINDYHELCKAVMQRDGYKCQSCGFRDNLACHHVVYRSRQGADTKENLVTVCAVCHPAIHAGHLFVEFDEKPEVFHFLRKDYWRPK